MSLSTCHRIDVMAALSAGYDLRCGRDEIRRVWSDGIMRYRYRYTVNGRTAMESDTTRRVFNLFLVGRSPDDIEIVSPRYRARRFQAHVWTDQPDPPIDADPPESDRFNNEPVSELLPDYRISLRDFLSD